MVLGLSVILLARMNKILTREIADPEEREKQLQIADKIITENPLAANVPDSSHVVQTLNGAKVIHRLQ